MLTPQARGIAAASLGLAYVTGTLTQIGVAVLLVFTQVHNLSQRSTDAGLEAVMVLVGGAIYVMGARAARRLADGWPRWVAQAGQILAVVGVLMSALAMVAALTGWINYVGGAFTGLGGGWPRMSG